MLCVNLGLVVDAEALTGRRGGWPGWGVSDSWVLLPLLRSIKLCGYVVFVLLLCFVTMSASDPDGHKTFGWVHLVVCFKKNNNIYLCTALNLYRVKCIKKNEKLLINIQCQLDQEKMYEFECSWTLKNKNTELIFNSVYNCFKVQLTFQKQ